MNKPTPEGPMKELEARVSHLDSINELLDDQTGDACFAYIESIFELILDAHDEAFTKKERKAMLNNLVEQLLEDAIVFETLTHMITDR